MEKISNDYRENVRMLDGLLGVGRSCDMVSRDYLIGGRRARLWVVDGFGSDSILERMGAFWLSLNSEAVAGLTQMQDFLDRFITFSESNVTFDVSDAVTSVFLGKSLLPWRAWPGWPSWTPRATPAGGWTSRRTARCFAAATTVSWRPSSPTWPCCAAASGTPT